MGLAGSGKTTLALALQKKLKNADYHNADIVRQKYNDFDFSEEGRLRQAHRFDTLCAESNKMYQIADFICPTKETRAAFNPDFVIHMDTVKECESVNGPAAEGSTFEQTNELFQKPEDPDVIVTTKDVDKWVTVCYNKVLKTLPRW